MNRFLTIDRVPLYGICEFNGQKIVKLKVDSNGVYVAFWPYDVNFGLTFMDNAAAQSTVCNYIGYCAAEPVVIENNTIKSYTQVEYKVVDDSKFDDNENI